MTNLLLDANKMCKALRQQQRTLGVADIAAFTMVYEGIVHEGEQLNPEAVNPNMPFPAARRRRAALHQRFGRAVYQ